MYFARHVSSVSYFPHWLLYVLVIIVKIMDFQNIFSFNPSDDSYVCDMEILVREEKERNSLMGDYKNRFLSNKEG